MLDEADPLSDPHLLLFGQLGCQPGLAGSGVIHGHMDLLLKTHITITIVNIHGSLLVGFESFNHFHATQN